MSFHAIERAMERYGLEIDETTIQHIAQACRAGRAGLICRTTRGDICELMVGGVIVRVVYSAGRDPGDDVIKTFLPRDGRALVASHNAARKRREYLKLCARQGRKPA